MTTPRPFTDLPLQEPLLLALADLEFTTMTLVQEQTLPHVLAGRDVLARARTGSGKTAAFALGVLNKLRQQDFLVQCLVLCPTRELADQVAKEFRRLARRIANVKVLTLCGGMPIGPQIGSLERNPHIVVGTCGRVLKHLGKGTLELDRITTLVLDEADRMLDMGFEDELEQILGFLPAKRQTLLFSATYPDSIAGISARVQQDPIAVDVTGDEQPVQVQQRWCEVKWPERRDALMRSLTAWGGALNLVFCNTKVECDEVVVHLRKQGVAAIALHGDLDQTERTRELVRFANGSATVLVATDVAARGLDIKDLDAVINYELPPQPEVYVHRVGRTGRAGSSGVAVSLVADREMGRLVAIETALDRVTIERSDVPPAGGSNPALIPAMTTLEINGGRKQKLRPGDLLGALTADGGVPGDAVGNIDLFEFNTFVAIRNDQAQAALAQIKGRPVKGREFRARLV